MNLNFRLLRADEIDARVSNITEKSVMLLLYKDARCDMSILDETVGPLNWQRVHSRENANCTVSIWDDDKKQWIGKEDTGTESNTEKEKGLASDSFKRACINWGIGRELYTSPSIFFPRELTGAKKGTQGRDVCYDRFSVKEIEYDGRSIAFVTIVDDTTGKEKSFGKRMSAPAVNEEKPAEKPARKPAAKKPAPAPEEPDSPMIQLMKLCAKDHIDDEWVAKNFGRDGVMNMTDKEIAYTIKQWSNVIEKYNR